MVENSSSYIARPLGNVLRTCHSKVAILEGARAVGKTSLVKHELESNGYKYYSLADQKTYESALRDVDEWVQTLSLPAIIDEAQRVSDLPLAVKGRIDATGSNSLQVVLTGSASINRGGLDGQNPLTRRSRNFTLFPLTAWEIERNKGSLVDALWDANPKMAFSRYVSRSDVFSRMNLGGFPIYVTAGGVMSPRERSLAIRSDIDGVLGDNVLPGEKFDRVIARSALKSLLGMPGGIFNASKLSRELNCDARTVQNYMSIFERRFLIHALPNLKAPAHKQNFTRAKIHPIDTSLSCEEMISSGKNPMDDSVLFGELFESYVVNQLVASAQWSLRNPDCFYWRDAVGRKPREVDLVLLDDDEMIGIEVKSAQRVREDDFRGLRALAEDSRFTRGYVVYTGDSFVKEADNLWAVPVAALWDSKAFDAPTVRETATMSNPVVNSVVSNIDAGVSVDASIFLSYSHDDNEYLDGAIIQLADSIAREYQFQFGSKLELFVDVRQISWGENWRRALDRALIKTTFLMPAVTPGYISSSACREELQKFLSRSDGSGTSHILSAVWQPFRDSSSAKQNPDFTALIEENQYEDVSALRDLDPKDREYRMTVRKLVDKIHVLIQEDIEASGRERSGARDKQGVRTAADRQEEGALDQLIQLNDSIADFKADMENVAEDMNDIGALFSKHAIPQGGNLRDLQVWSLRMEKDAKEPMRQLRLDLGKSRKEWERMFGAAQSYIRLIDAFPVEGEKRSAITDFRTQLIATGNSFLQMDEFEQAIDMFQFLGVMAPRLRFIGNGLKEFGNTMIDMRASLDDLIAQLDEL